MLIAITGIDGSGKSTQIGLLKRFLKKNHYPVFISKACGKAEKKCLNKFFQYWDSLTITFVFQGLHRQQYVEALKAIKAGNIVLADRWDETFLSFHSKFGYLSKHKDLMLEWNNLAFNKFIPDLTFFIDTPSKITHQRLVSRGKDFLDKGSKRYHEQIRRATIKALKGRPVIVIDGTQSINHIHKIIVSQVSKKLKFNMPV